MKIIATNIGKPTTITWNGKEEKTGIYKYPTHSPIFLGESDVLNDTVIDRKHHGGENKACYLFSSEAYSYWKPLYPNLNWNWGMFGENLTVEGLNEAKIRIGDIYELGTAIVQISQPREPCYKLGIRFKSSRVIKQFIAHGYPGTYVKVIQKGEVKTGDNFILQKQSPNELTIKNFYKLLFDKEKNKDILKLAIQNEALPQYKRDKLKKYLL